MKYLLIAIALLVSGCGANHYDSNAQGDYRDTLNPANRFHHTGQKGNG